MINAQELRRMNLVSIDGKSFEVDMIFKDRITTTTGHKFFVSDIEPIPLSPEILEKCGFVKHHHFNQYYKSGNIGYDFLSNRLEKLNSFDMRCELGECKYVHQLQNAIFSLTNTELTITI